MHTISAKWYETVKIIHVLTEHYVGEKMMSIWNMKQSIIDSSITSHPNDVNRKKPPILRLFYWQLFNTNDFFIEHQSQKERERAFFIFE